MDLGRHERGNDPRNLDIDHTRTERRRNLATSGGVLGWGVPAAVGAHIGRQDRECWALVGDGCFQFGLHGLWTAARYEVPVGIVIWNNGQYQANRRFLHAYGGRAAETGKDIGCNLASPEIDNVALAKGSALTESSSKLRLTSGSRSSGASRR